MHASRRSLASYSTDDVPPLPMSNDYHEQDIVRAARTGACVLFTGSSLAAPIAFQIHRSSGWRWGIFRRVDCGAADPVLERTLFGPMERDLIPANRDEPWTRLRQPGTLFLEEVGRLSAASQDRLRALLVARATGRGRSYRRLMASSSAPLLPRVADGTFDAALFYQLNTVHFMLG